MHFLPYWADLEGLPRSVVYKYFFFFFLFIWVHSICRKSRREFIRTALRLSDRTIDSTLYLERQGSKTGNSHIIP